MATLRQIRRRIRSVRSTMQITKAMEMLSAAKLRKAQAQAHASRAYAGATEGILASVASDHGLCGGFSTSVVEALLPRYAHARICAILTISLAAEHWARMLAMGNATRNAIDMIETLTLTANKVRQAAITKELLEIVGGGAGIA